MTGNSVQPLGAVAKRVMDQAQQRSGQAPESTVKIMDQIQCQPDCPTCGGIGYIRYDVQPGHERFGKLFPCPELPIHSPIYSESGLTQDERALSWKKSLLHRKDDKAAEASLVEAVTAVKAALAAQRGVVLLYGGNGLAKSLILKIAVAETLRQRRGVMGRYIQMAEIMEDLRTSYDAEQPGRSLKEMEMRYAKYPVLCIDELGVERDTEFTAEKQFMLIDRRYTASIENQAPLVTILATNLSINEFPARIADRLSDGRCAQIKLVGESMRPGLKQDTLI